MSLPIMTPNPEEGSAPKTKFSIRWGRLKWVNVDTDKDIISPFFWTYMLTLKSVWIGGGRVCGIALSSSYIYVDVDATTHFEGNLNARTMIIMNTKVIKFIG